MGVLYLLVQGLLNYSHFEGQYYPSWNFFFHYFEYIIIYYHALKQKERLSFTRGKWNPNICTQSGLDSMFQISKVKMIIEILRQASSGNI